LTSLQLSFLLAFPRPLIYPPTSMQRRARGWGLYRQIFGGIARICMGNFKNLPAATQPHPFVARPQNFRPRTPHLTTKISQSQNSTPSTLHLPRVPCTSQLTFYRQNLAYPAPARRTLHLLRVPCTLRTLHLTPKIRQLKIRVPCTSQLKSNYVKGFIP
jgi:hypothetical protein